MSAVSTDVSGALRLGRALSWMTLGLGFFLLALLLTLPAAQLVAWLKLPLADVRGSVWQGEARLALPRLQLQSLSWRMGLGAPWATPLVAQIKLKDDSLHAQGRLGLHWDGALSLYDAQADLRLNHPLLTQRLPMALDGALRFSLSAATWSQGVQQAKGVRLELDGLRLLSSEPLILGSFAAQGEVTDGKLTAKLRDTAGVLSLQGAVQGDAASGVSLNARAQAKADAPAELRDMLSLLPAAPDGGASLQGRVPAPWLAKQPEK
ncbi:MAG: type II secretion system protein N [Pseudomonadota bacterium]